MIHAIYITTIVLLVAAGFWLLNQLRKVVDEKIEKEEQLDRISKGVFELFEYAKSDEKKAIYKLGEWVQTDGTIIEGLKLYNEAHIKHLTTQIERLEKRFKWLRVCGVDEQSELLTANLSSIIEKLKTQTEKTETLSQKLQSAYGRIGALTQQVSRLKKEGEKEAAKADVEKVEVEKVELPKKCPEHVFEKFPEDIKQMAWEVMCSTSKVKAQRAYEKKNCYSLDSAFMWAKTPQGRKFWDSWFLWGIDGADPNNMPPTDPNDPVYK